ncbi:hypothetical protein [Candidatus Nitrosocosmicus sp. FF01]|uniref:hypothetical protein n=1 Tax=Candidatus Nitrosocosmicus sp. FF01 TaxID=3397670 RepID=UPI0039ED78A7
MSEINKSIGSITSKITEHGAPVIEQLLDKLTGKGALVKYNFEDLKIEMPSATDPKGRTIGGGKMIIHGTITVSARVQKINNESEGSISKSGNVNDSYGSMRKNSDNITTNNIEKESFKTLDDEPALKDYDSSNEINST